MHSLKLLRELDCKKGKKNSIRAYMATMRKMVNKLLHKEYNEFEWLSHMSMVVRV